MGKDIDPPQKSRKLKFEPHSYMFIKSTHAATPTLNSDWDFIKSKLRRGTSFGSQNGQKAEMQPRDLPECLIISRPTIGCFFLKRSAGLRQPKQGRETILDKILLEPDQLPALLLIHNMFSILI